MAVKQFLAGLNESFWEYMFDSDWKIQRQDLPRPWGASVRTLVGAGDLELLWPSWWMKLLCLLSLMPRQSGLSCYARKNPRRCEFVPVFQSPQTPRLVSISFFLPAFDWIGTPYFFLWLKYSTSRDAAALVSVSNVSSWLVKSGRVNQAVINKKKSPLIDFVFIKKQNPRKIFSDGFALVIIVVVG